MVMKLVAPLLVTNLRQRPDHGHICPYRSVPGIRRESCRYSSQLGLLQVLGRALHWAQHSAHGAATSKYYMFCFRGTMPKKAQ